MPVWGLNLPNKNRPSSLVRTGLMSQAKLWVSYNRKGLWRAPVILGCLNHPHHRQIELLLEGFIISFSPFLHSDCILGRIQDGCFHFIQLLLWLVSY